MANIVSTWWSDFKAWRRGDRRIVARGVRGRIYEKRAQPVPSTGIQKVEQKTTFSVTARVIHADGSPDTYHKL